MICAIFSLKFFVDSIFFFVNNGQVFFFKFVKFVDKHFTFLILANQTNMDKVFESYQNYINNKDLTDDESDFEFFSDDDDFELSILNNDNRDKICSDGSKDEENDLTKLKQLADLNIFTGEDFLKKLEKYSTDDTEQSSLTNMTAKDCKHLIIDAEHVSQEYPKKIASIFKSKYNQLVDQLKTRNESSQQQFERRIKLITNQISRSDDSSYLNKFNELINSMHDSIEELKINIKNYEILHQIFQKKE